jgi:hypothetical protein
MGVDFADLSHSGRFDMVVSNITTAWGLEESNFAWMNEASTPAQMATEMAHGNAPFVQRAREMGLAWTGWGWDVKAADFRNDGNLEIVQAEGFVRGDIDRWAWLQEMAMNNDNVFTNPGMWPDVQPGDDLAGRQPFAFYAKDARGTFVNINRELGMATTTTPSRGIAIADTRGIGALDFAVARQWDAPEFYTNTSARGSFLNLELYRPAVNGGAVRGPMQAVGSPAYGATVTVTDSAGRRQVSQVDGGGGHSGKRSFTVHFGLGDSRAPVVVDISWRDSSGILRTQVLELAPGTHSLLLDTTAQEVSNS